MYLIIKLQFTGKVNISETVHIIKCLKYIKQNAQNNNKILNPSYLNNLAPCSKVNKFKLSKKW